MTMYHVAFLRDAALDGILAGTKRREFRLSINWAPFMLVDPGHRIFLKRVRAEIEVIADVERVERLIAGNVEQFAAQFATSPAEIAYLQAGNGSRHGVAILLANIRRVIVPAQRTPRGIRMGWVANFDPGDWREIAE